MYAAASFIKVDQRYGNFHTGFKPCNVELKSVVHFYLYRAVFQLYINNPLVVDQS